MRETINVILGKEKWGFNASGLGDFVGVTECSFSDSIVGGTVGRGELPRDAVASAHVLKSFTCKLSAFVTADDFHISVSAYSREVILERSGRIGFVLQERKRV